MIMNVLRHILNSIHMVMHLLIGLILAQIVTNLHSIFTIQYFLLPAIIGSFLPDLDHMLYFYTYGKQNPYSKNIRKLLKRGNVIGFVQYCVNHHKELTCLYSHSIISMMIFLTLGLMILYLQYLWWSVLLLSVAGHFLYDMLEDIMLLGRLNKNWTRNL